MTLLLVCIGRDNDITDYCLSYCRQSTAKVGDPVVYKGIDFIIVDVQKAKILNVYTSADYIREIKQKGFPLEACPAK